MDNVKLIYDIIGVFVRDLEDKAKTIAEHKDIIEELGERYARLDNAFNDLKDEYQRLVKRVVK